MFLLFAACLGAHAQERVQTFPLTGTQDLVEHNVKVEAAEYKGRKAVRLTVAGQPQGLAFLRDTEFADGTIEADIAVKVTTPPAIRNPGFIGLAFRSRSDAVHYDRFFLRPGNASSEDQARRNHSVQYVAMPDFDFYRMRKWSGAYEAYADLQTETWTRVKIEVEGRRARLYVNGAAHPVLVVDGLKGEDLKGGVGLWGSGGQENYFSNVRITHAKRQPIENGGEAAGIWEVKYSTETGNYSGLIKLQRDGGTVSGTSSGLRSDFTPPSGKSFGMAGTDLLVTGIWRNGYLELAFHGTWLGPGDPGEATVNLAGWVDGSSARGRVSSTGRADGIWTATRKE